MPCMETIWEEVMHYTRRANGEILFLADLGVSVASDNRSMILSLENWDGDTNLPPQDAWSGWVDGDDTPVTDWIEKRFPIATRARTGVNMAWIHSHVNGSPTPSSRDLLTINTLCAYGGIIATVIVNKQGDVSVRVDYNISLQNGTHIPATWPCRWELVREPFVTAERAKVLNTLFDTRVTETSHTAKVDKLATLAVRTDRYGKAAQVELAKRDKNKAATPTTQVDDTIAAFFAEFDDDYVVERTAYIYRTGHSMLIPATVTHEPNGAGIANCVGCECTIATVGAEHNAVCGDCQEKYNLPVQRALH